MAKNTKAADDAVVDDVKPEESELDPAALAGFWRWLVIAKKPIDGNKLSNGNLVYSGYCKNTDRHFAVVDYTGGEKKLIADLELGPELPDRAAPWGLAFAEPSVAINTRLTKSEQKVADELRDLLA